MPTSRAIRLTPAHRILMLILIVLQHVLTIWGLALFLNYALIQFLSQDYASLVSGIQLEEEVPVLRNAVLFTLFWLQHILMATIKYKKIWFFKSQYFVLYERYLFNAISGITLWFIFANAKPVNHPLFTLPFFVYFPLLILGVVLLTLSMIQLGYHIFMPYRISDIIYAEEIRYIPYESKADQGLKVTGAYAYCRNPMQAGSLLLMIFGGGLYTTDRLLFVLIMSTGVIIGVFLQEKRMLCMFNEYSDYMKKVPGRFIPYLI